MLDAYEQPYVKAPVRAAGVSTCRQVGTLLRRKELKLKMKRPLTSVCEILLPVVLCGLVLLSKLARSEFVRVGNMSFTQDTYEQAVNTLGPLSFVEAITASQGAQGDDIQAVRQRFENYTNATGVPNAIWPLSGYLEYATAPNISFCRGNATTRHGRECFDNVIPFFEPQAPFDGTFLAVTPDTVEVRSLLHDIFHWVNMSFKLHVDAAAWDGKSPVPSENDPKHTLRIRYFRNESELEAAAVKGMSVWCAAIFEGGWGAANWSFSLRYNHSEVPLTKRNIDKFTPGLSTKFAMYYSSGFLSLQTAISDAIIRHELGGADDLGLFVYASPFPVPEYSNNRFLDHAGPLVGLVIVLSFLIPLATMLRALVLEKESKLREGLLMSGLSLPAYYQSIVITYGGTFVLVALLAAFIITPNLFPLSSFFLVLLLFVLFALAVLAYTCAISSFFSNARVAAILGPLSLFLSTQIIFIFLDRQTGVLEEGMAGAKTIASLLPAMGFYLGVSRLSLYEGAEQAVTMQNLFEGEFSYGSSLVLLAFDIVLWSALAWYLDQVVPSEYGLQKPWYFCCLPSHWCGSSTSGVGDEHVSASLLQPLGGEGALPPPLVIEDDAEPVRGMGVRTQGLRKKFYSGPNDGVAVAGLDLRMNPGQITSLLGANGAGKTTTVSMLTGLIQPSGGNASIDGLSVRTGMRQIRRSLGVCPQQNVIFLPLTPVDHLILHGELKGLRGIELDQQMREILNHVGLVERAYVPAAALSGGQKRKLCLAIALIGSPATCFLDEPTSGMDPHSRRSIWALLRTKREGRTIVLTTHFLDEAEILSDRIAIMAEGSLRCVGSPLFLKARLGCGYRLTVSKVVGEFASEKLLTLLRKHEPDAEIMVDERFYSEVKLPSGNIGGFSALFSELDTSLSALGVTEYGLTCTTLEDVFLRINEKNLERLDQLRTTQVEAPSTPAEGVSAAPANGGRSCCTPSGQSSSPAIGAPQGGGVRSAVATAPQVSTPINHSKQGHDREARMRGGSTLGQWSALVRKRRLQAQRDVCATCCQLLFPVVIVFLALNLLSINLQETGPQLPMVPSVALGPSDSKTPRPPPKLRVPTGELSFGVAREQTTNLSSYLIDEGWDLDDTFLPDGAAVFPSWPSDLADALLSAKWEEKQQSATGAGSVGANLPPAALGLTYTEGTDIGPVKRPGVAVPTLMFESKQMHALPTLLGSLYDARLRQATGGARNLTAFSHPLPRTRTEQAIISIALSAFVSIMILIPFAFVAASFVTPHVRERESGSKQLQFVSGVGGPTYWFASWVWDVTMYCLVLVCTLGVFLLMGRSEFTGTGEAFGATTLLLGSFGLASIGFASVASFCFQTPSNALLIMIAFHFISGFGLVIADTVFMIVGGSAYEVDETLHSYVYPLFPAFCLGRGFIVLSTRAAFSELPAKYHRKATPPLYSWSELASPITFLLLETVVSMALTLLLQTLSSYRHLAKTFCGCFWRSGAPSTASESSGARGGADDGEDASVVEERAAVDRLDDGECFGFLGVNGAGKTTTTFSMLTGALQPSSGDATLRGLSILSSQDELRKLVGFCPQHDALESLLTPRETLCLYAHIKGVPTEHIPAEVEGLLRDLDLKMFEHKQAGTLSGGNKRKLCVGVALIGSPLLLLLDEPSSGMDAASKRFLWAVIKRRTVDCCTVLTTHSMEECEALCSRIGVMVAGSMRCLGPIQTLKSRYGQGFKLDLRLGPNAPSLVETVVELVAQGCPGTKLEESEPPCLTLTIPQRDLTLAAIFAHMSHVRERCDVIECSLTQCTLEQVFLLMASKQGLRSSASGDALEEG